MSPEYEPPPPAYDNHVADPNDIYVLHSKRGSYIQKDDDDGEPHSTDNTSEVGKTQV